MNFKYKLLLLLVAFFFNSVCYITADDIPVAIWNMNGDAMHIKPVSALGHNDESFVDILKSIPLENTKVLAFVLNALSMEDFPADDKSSSLNNTLLSFQNHFENQPYMFLPSVTNPLKHLHKVPCGIQEIVVDKDMDISQLTFGKSCVHIIHIADGTQLNLKDESFQSQFSEKKLLGIFTAERSSWGASNNDYHISRNLLATADPDPNFVNFTGCIIMYAESATLEIGGENNSTTNLQFPVSTNGSDCSGNTTVLQINFPSSGSVSSVVLKFRFGNSGGYWKTTSTVTITGGKAPAGEIDLNSQYLEAPVGFSYSCGKLELKSKNATYAVTIKIDRFQIQPFGVNGKFSESFDCVPYFTIPIWMGIFVSVLFIVIMNIGIYALFSVHTMDRFDDPKGKSISVAASGD